MLEKVQQGCNSNPGGWGEEGGTVFKLESRVSLCCKDSGLKRGEELNAKTGSSATRGEEMELGQRLSRK